MFSQKIEHSGGVFCLFVVVSFLCVFFFFFFLLLLLFLPLTPVFSFVTFHFKHGSQISIPIDNSISTIPL